MRNRILAALSEVLVVVYRDRPEYAAGRERWSAYQRDVRCCHAHQMPKPQPSTSPQKASV